VWHTGEESGMWGSGFFMDHPTISRDSIVAQLNIDMVGRGAATDVTGQAKSTTPGMPGAELHGGDHYLQLVGSRRLSTELGDLVEKVNTDRKHGFIFDYNIDADGHQQNIYCRSDHWSYGKWGIPVVFFTTGGHADYHQYTDEPQYIRYDHMAEVDKLIFDIAVATADLDHRVVVDHPKPNPAPATSCKQ
jgi:Zn-dependent M28 family amino/carboxypeptidase